MHIYVFLFILCCHGQAFPSRFFLQFHASPAVKFTNIHERQSDFASAGFELRNVGGVETTHIYISVRFHPLDRKSVV